MSQSAEIPSLFESARNSGMYSSSIVFRQSSMNSSLDMDFESTFFSFSTSLRVGRPLLSVPNGLRTSKPFILLNLAMKSCWASPKACPMWSFPEMVGGGVSRE